MCVLGDCAFIGEQQVRRQHLLAAIHTQPTSAKVIPRPRSSSTRVAGAVSLHSVEQRHFFLVRPSAVIEVKLKF
jgi:hypothetical protein